MIILLSIKRDEIQRKSHAIHTCDWAHESNRVMLMYYNANEFQIPVCIAFRRLSALELCVY